MLPFQYQVGYKLVPSKVSDMVLLRVAVVGATAGNIMTTVDPGAHISGDRISAISFTSGNVGAFVPGNEQAAYIMDARVIVRSAAIVGGDPSHWSVYIQNDPGTVQANVAALIAASTKVMDLINTSGALAANASFPLLVKPVTGLTAIQTYCPPSSGLFIVNGDDGAVYVSGNLDILLLASIERDY